MNNDQLISSVEIKEDSKTVNTKFISDVPFGVGILYRFLVIFSFQFIIFLLLIIFREYKIKTIEIIKLFFILLIYTFPVLITYVMNIEKSNYARIVLFFITSVFSLFILMKFPLTGQHLTQNGKDLAYIFRFIFLFS